MPANIRVRCLASDCQHLNGLFCETSEIEVSPADQCLSYKPVELEEVEDEEDIEGDDLPEDEEWLEEEEEEGDDTDAYGDDE
jgi:hypothetical protein